MDQPGSEAGDNRSGADVKISNETTAKLPISVSTLGTRSLLLAMDVNNRSSPVFYLEEMASRAYKACMLFILTRTE